MKTAFAFAFLVAGCTSSSGVEKGIPPGGGYDAAIIAGPDSSSFEGAGHFRYLRRDRRKIASIGDCEASPDGIFIASKKIPTSRILILEKYSGRAEPLAPTSAGLVRKFDWSSEPGYLWLEIYDKPPVRLQIP